MKERFAEIKKMSYKDLLKEKNELVSKYLIDSAKLVSSGNRNNKKTKDIKREIAWVETFISEKIYTQAEED